MKLKSELYNKEQNEICNKIITILNLDSNSSFILKELDYDEEKKRMILELIPDIRRYFSFSSIIGVADTEKAKRPYMSIIRQICKLKYMLRKPNEKEVKTMKYFFYIKQ